MAFLFVLLCNSCYWSHLLLFSRFLFLQKNQEKKWKTKKFFMQIQIQKRSDKNWDEFCTHVNCASTHLLWIFHEGVYSFEMTSSLNYFFLTSWFKGRVPSFHSFKVKPSKKDDNKKDAYKTNCLEQYNVIFSVCLYGIFYCRLWGITARLFSNSK